ncbi:TIGR03067 domain-containing protein [Zavarzinella formosa]|uniref:TIGR03067 domain-containing protein n=1 Tax=Zavarzinella formosa TaxID=360055 RepID=UPI0003669DEC|nr:TIGR03067 domain-containing protein [Zavarzinella formosa]
MIAFNLRNSTAVLFASCCIVSVAMFHPPVAGQSPVPEKKDTTVKVAAGGQVGSDKDKIQGNWRIMSLDLGFKVIKREDELAEWKDTFDTEMVFKDDRHGQAGQGGSKFKLDETRDPKQITVYSDDGKQTFRGIYTLEGDTLKMCMNGDGTSVCRPEEFVTKKGQAVIITTLKRAAAKK